MATICFIVLMYFIYIFDFREKIEGIDVRLRAESFKYFHSSIRVSPFYSKEGKYIFF